MPTVADVLRRYGDGYLERFGAAMPAEHKKVLSLFPKFYSLIAGGSKPVFLLRWDSTP